MATKRRKHAPPLHLDMPMGEALERLAGTDPKEVAANIAKSRAAKPLADRKLQSANKPDDHNVTELSRRRKPKNVRKLLLG